MKPIVCSVGSRFCCFDSGRSRSKKDDAIATNSSSSLELVVVWKTKILDNYLAGIAVTPFPTNIRHMKWVKRFCLVLQHWIWLPGTMSYQILMNLISFRKLFSWKLMVFVNQRLISLSPTAFDNFESGGSSYFPILPDDEEDKAKSHP